MTAKNHAGTRHAPPAHLEADEAALFTRIQAEFGITDSAGLSLLAAACDHHARARRCRDRINLDGELTDEGKMHPLLPSERQSRQNFVAAVQALGLDLEGAGEPGRPPALQRVR